MQNIKLVVVISQDSIKDWQLDKSKEPAPVIKDSYTLDPKWEDKHCHIAAFVYN